MDRVKKIPDIRFPEFTDDWEQRKLSDIVDVLDGDRGKNYPTERDFNDNGHTLFLNASNVTTEGFLFEDTQYISEEKSNSMGNGKLEEDDIVVTSRGSLGHIAWYNSDIKGIVPYARINSGMLILRKKSEIYTSYLYQFMKTHKGQGQISFISFGSAQPQLTKKGVENIEVVLPNRETEQKQIADYFYNLDNLITLHQRKCEAIKDYKKGLLQKMFPKEGKTIPEIRFPEFTDAWEQRKCKDFIRFSGGATPSKTNKEYWNGDITWLSSQEINKGGFVDDGTYMITQKAIDDGTTKMVKAGTPLFISRSGILAHSFPICRPTKDVAINQDIKALIFDNEKYDANYVVYMMENKAPFILKHIVKTGTTVQSVSMPDMDKMDVSIPNLVEQKLIGRYFLNLDNLITLHQRKCDAMRKYKKGLLQKMFI